MTFAAYQNNKCMSNREQSDQDLLNLFGNNLRTQREKKELSQEQVAYQAGFSRSYYTEVETGKRNISLLNILKIASLLQIELTDLIELKDFSKK
jgi:transcriptional regulator with XRE-family HTH domain